MTVAFKVLSSEQLQQPAATNVVTISCAINSPRADPFHPGPKLVGQPVSQIDRVSSDQLTSSNLLCRFLPGKIFPAYSPGVIVEWGGVGSRGKESERSISPEFSAERRRRSDERLLAAQGRSDIPRSLSSGTDSFPPCLPAARSLTKPPETPKYQKLGIVFRLRTVFKLKRKFECRLEIYHYKLSWYNINHRILKRL